MYLLLYKINKDHLEVLFSVMKNRGAFNNNSNAVQFLSVYKRLLVHHETSGSAHIEIAHFWTVPPFFIQVQIRGVRLMQFSIITIIKNHNILKSLITAMSTPLEDYVEDVNYISGFIVRIIVPNNMEQVV